jgi:pyruvate-ferredoxin/flavodoxin oxidoreductase
MAYSPCINHGILKGMGKAQEEANLAVKSGYWPLYRYNPVLKEQGKNPFTLDSKAPDGSLQEFLAGEVRYASLKKTFPEESAKLSVRLEEEYTARYAALQMLADPESVLKAKLEEEKMQEQSDEETKEQPKEQEPLPVCEMPGGAEDTRMGDQGEPCDDGRGGNI